MGAKLVHSFIPKYPVIFLFFSFIFVTIPVCFCDDKLQYEECAGNLYECGDLKGIGYPFWGGDRNLSCGHQGFELRCRDDEYAVMRIDSLDFRVLSISESSYTMTIARTDFWNETCPKEFISTTLNYNLFDYASTNRNLSLFYGCSDEALSQLPANFTIRNNFTCYVEGTGDNTTAFFTDETFIRLSEYVDVLETCEINVTLPLITAALDELKASDTEGEDVSNVVRLEKALNKGFEVDYSLVRGLCVQCNEYGGICGSSSTSSFTCHCPDNKSYQYACPKSVSGIAKKITVAAFGAGVGIVLVIILIIFKIKISKLRLRSVWRKRSEADQNIEEFVNNYGSQAPKRYSYSDVKKMTHSFKDKLGQGGYGSVYKGKLADGNPVAVKVLNTSKGNGEEFINEVASISRTSHVNIVSLLGFCFEGGKKALIYEFMSHGSLENYVCSTGHQDPLTASKHLGWEKLYEIAVGIARGLEYLHSGCRTKIVHFDVKPHNILLNQDFSPKISDFGLAKICPPKESIVSMSVARGTIGYVAPEVFSRNFGRVSHKSDVYSYGMMVLEMVGGRRNENGTVDRTSDTYFPHWIYKKLEQQESVGVLEGIRNKEEDEITRKMMLVGLWCIQTDPSQRPGMSKVIEMLEGSLEALQVPPKPFLSSPPRLPTDSSSSNSTQSNDGVYL